MTFYIFMFNIKMPGKNRNQLSDDLFSKILNCQPNGLR